MFTIVIKRGSSEIEIELILFYNECDIFVTSLKELQIGEYIRKVLRALTSIFFDINISVLKKSEFLPKQ